jgi:hypothetical protein
LSAAARSAIKARGGRPGLRAGRRCLGSGRWQGA